MMPSSLASHNSAETKSTAKYVLKNYCLEGYPMMAYFVCLVCCGVESYQTSQQTQALNVSKSTHDINNFEGTVTITSATSLHPTET